MKALKYFLFLCMTLTYTGMMTSCGSQSHNNDHSHSHGEDGNHDHGNSHGEDGDEHDHDDDVDGHDHDATSHGEGIAFTSEYVCPMHCKNSGSKVAGKCPVCNMDYVAYADHVKDGHKH